MLSADFSLFFDWAIGTPVSPRELDCIPDKLSVSSQSDDRQPAYNMLYTLY